jgi:hypothetical protein
MRGSGMEVGVDLSATVSRVKVLDGYDSDGGAG